MVHQPDPHQIIIARELQLSAGQVAATAKLHAERELLNDELQAALQSARSLTGLEDIYLPYRPKRKTAA